MPGVEEPNGRLIPWTIWEQENQAKKGLSKGGAAGALKKGGGGGTGGTVTMTLEGEARKCDVYAMCTGKAQGKKK